MIVLSDANLRLILGLCALACGAGSAVWARAVLRRARHRAWSVPLAVVGGARTFLVASLMAAIVVAHGTGASFWVYEEGGGFTLMFRIKDWTTTAMAGGVLCLPLELGYLVVARARGKRGLWKTEYLLLAPFAILVVLFLSDIGMFVPMV
jgi:hypothetical protein